MRNSRANKELYPVYTSNDGSRITFLNWGLRLVRLTSDAEYVEIHSSFTGRKNYYIHAHKEKTLYTGRENGIGIYLLQGKRNVKVPLYVMNAAKQLLGVNEE